MFNRLVRPWLNFLNQGAGYVLIQTPTQTLQRTSSIWLLGGFAAFYIILIIFFRQTSSHDPTSFFFDPLHGYASPHSTQRILQGEAFVNAVNGSATYPKARNPKLCVGIATTTRPSTQYVRGAVGSLLDGLSDDDRQNIHLVLFIAHTEPTAHPIYSEAWVEALPDKLLLYDKNSSMYDQLQKWEIEKTHSKKGMYDYRYLLQHCYDSNVPWVAVLEDDIVAEKDWYKRTIQALGDITHRTQRKRNADWLYLRLFFTEAYLGWNSEEWPIYLSISLLLDICLITILALIRAHSRNLQPYLSKTFIAVACLVCLPALITLYFLAGRVSMQPLATGVFEMMNFGCCSQGLVFPRSHVKSVVDLLQRQQDGFVDMTIEAWAMKNTRSRWAINPSVLQHVGKKSSKGADADAPAAKIWNFGFEMHSEDEAATVGR